MTSLEQRNTFRHAARHLKPFENEFVADDIRGTGEIMAMNRAVLLPSSNSSKFSYREGGRGDDCSLSVLSTFHVWDCSFTLPTNKLQHYSDDRAVRVCGCLSSICVRREKSLRSLAKAGQTRDTRTRVVKHTCASLREEDHA